MSRVVVVTGAAQGIGEAIATRFCRSGAHVVVADANSELGQRTAARIGGAFAPVDVTDTATVVALRDAVVARFGRIDVLVNNAGIGHEDAALEVDDELWARVLSVDLAGTFAMSREFARRFREQGGGAIVNVASISGIIGTSPEHHVAYDVAKAGVIQLTRSLAVEWASLGIRVNAVAPGRTRTPILDVVGAEDPARLTEWIGQVPQRRIFEPQEIAEAVFFLGDPASSAITGHTLVADGGQTVA